MPSQAASKLVKSARLEPIRYLPRPSAPLLQPTTTKLVEIKAAVSQRYTPSPSQFEDAEVEEMSSFAGKPDVISSSEKPVTIENVFGEENGTISAGKRPSLLSLAAAAEIQATVRAQETAEHERAVEPVSETAEQATVVSS
jgi:hypothetical protein